MNFSIVIPSYNEEKRINKTLGKLLRGFNREEIIVVDDGSTDKTSEIARDLGVSVIRHEKNMGKGRAIVTGFLEANGDIIGFVDADESVSIGDIKKVFGQAEKGVVAVASRRHPSSKILVKRPLIRSLSSRLFNLFVKIFFGLDIGDTQCGCKAFPKTVAKKLVREVKCNGFEIDGEVL